MTLATALSASPPVTDAIRPCVREDISGVARLFDIAFFRGPGRRLPGLEAYLTDLYFSAPPPTMSQRAIVRNVGCRHTARAEARGSGASQDCPLQDHAGSDSTALSSYVCEDAAGQVGGFIGTHPRAFVFEGEPITAAAYGQLMVRPDLQGQGIARELCRRFYEGGQVFSFSTTVSRTRRIDLSLGAHNPPFYGLSWRKTLRLGRVTARRLAGSRKLGPLRHLFSPLVRYTRPPASGTSHSIEIPDRCEMETVYRHAFDRARLYPAYDASMFKWKLDMLGRSSRHRAFAGVVRDGRDPIGFYVWLLERDGRGTVIDMLAARRHHEAVMGHVLAHAHENGAESIGGSCGDAHEVIAAQKAGASLSYSPSTYVVHSRNEDVLRCFLDNPPYLSAFDGDAWLDFPRV